MKKKILKVISVVLVAVMCIMISSPVFASEIDRTCPKVYVHGFMAQDVYVDVNDPDSELAWPPSQDKILATVKDAIPLLAKLAVDRNLDKFGADVAVLADALFEDICLDYNGEIANTSGIRFEYPDPESIKTDSTVGFKYDWRLDPMLIASQLNDFINYVLKCSGSKQVVLECHSLGGVITNTYLRLYGNSKIRSVVFNSSAVYGEVYTGELLKGELELNAASLRYFLEYCFDNTGYENTLSLILEMIENAGLLDFVCMFGDVLLEGVYDEVIPSVAKLFANWPTIWAMIPDEDVEAAKNNVFNNIYAKLGIDASGLEKKIDKFNKDVRPYKTQTLKNTAKTSNVYVISRYGYSAIPLTPSWNSLGDGVIDTKFSSFGATTAAFGEKLDVSDSAYISPDKTVDASTCLFPKQTWFIKNLKHSDERDCLEAFVDTLLYHKGLATVDTFAEYPRYMEYDFENDLLIADKEYAEITLSDKRRLALLEIWDAIKPGFLK